MKSSVQKALTSPLAGPAAAAMALFLAAVLAVSWSAWQGARSRLQGRIADLMRQTEASQSLWRAQLAACHAAAQPGDRTQVADAPAGDPAQQLLAQGPAGVDVCARMESADQAVLKTLKK